MKISLLTCLAFLASCDASSHQRKLVLYTDTPESLTLKLTDIFEKKYGIEVEEVMEGTSWLMTRLRAERARPIADVFMGASGTVPGVLGAREGIFFPYTPIAAQAWPWKQGKLQLRDKDWKWFAFAFASLGLVYSSAAVAALELPPTWESLAEPRWRGQLTMWDPSVSGTSTLFLVSSLERAINHGLGEEGGWKFLSGFYHNLKKYSEGGPPLLDVAHGVVRMGLHLDNQFLYYRQKSGPTGASVSFYLPPESPVLSDPAALVAGAPHPAEARLFLTFLLSEEAQRILGTTFWVRDASGRVHLPTGHPYGDKAKEAKKVGGKKQDTVARGLMETALEMDFERMAAGFDRARIHWQNHIEE
ncbi:MAG: extracellular solute-binding protein [Elusimicrobiota bacterium]